MRWLMVIAVMLSSQPAPAQQTVPPLEPDTIVVTGVRAGSRVGMVDYDKIWRRCAECKRALAKLAALSKPHAVKKGQIARDSSSFRNSVAEHTRNSPPIDISKGEASSDIGAIQAGNFLRQLPDHQRKDMAELGVRRVEMAKLIASFLAQLEPHARAAAEEERAVRQLAAIYDANGRAPQVKVHRVDVTEAVIRRLDARAFTIRLPDPPAAAR